MATIFGVRDLKLNAPQLVARAARGERIVITRYGKPQAQLGPIQAQSPVERSARMAEWQALRAVFGNLPPATVRRYRNQYVALHADRIIDSDPDQDALFERVWKRLEGRTFFVGRIGTPPPVVEMPGFEIE